MTRPDEMYRRAENEPKENVERDFLRKAPGYWRRPGFPWFEAAATLFILLSIALLITWITCPTVIFGRPMVKVNVFQAEVCKDASSVAEILVITGIIGAMTWLVFARRGDKGTQDRDRHKEEL